MWWLLPAATAAMSALGAQRRADQQERFNIAQSEQTRYSPWTGHAGQLDNSYTPSVLEGGLSGGVQGLGILQGFGAGPWGKPAGAMSATSQAGGAMALNNGGLQTSIRQDPREMFGRKRTLYGSWGE